MYFENREVDPRDCLYRASPKVRKQVEQVIKENKIKFGLIKSSKQIEDELNRSPKKNTVVKNRFNKTAKDIAPVDDNDGDEDKENDSSVLQAQFSPEKMISFVEQLDSILSQEEEQKQTFSYDTLVKMHQLLQYLEDDSEKNEDPKSMSFRSQFFYQFMESNFRPIPPEKRKNAALDDRLRKLKYQAAGSDYDSMTANVSRAIRSGFKSGSGANAKFTLSQEMRNIRSTLLATLNAFMVIVATFAFFYFAFSYARPNDSTANRVLFSFGASMVVAVAEVYFLIRII